MLVSNHSGFLWKFSGFELMSKQTVEPDKKGTENMFQR